MSAAAQSLQTNTRYPEIIKLAWPVAVSILIPQLSMLANTLFLGYYHPQNSNQGTQDLLAASGIAGIYYLTLTMIGQGFSSGLLMLLSRKAGENNPAGIGKYLSQAYWIAVGLSLTLMTITALFAPTLLGFGIHESSILQAAISFIDVRFWGLPFIFVVQIHHAFFLSTAQSRNIMAVAVVQAICNIIFDYLFIFGKAGLPELGLNGTAYASVLAEILACGVSILFLRKALFLDGVAIKLSLQRNWKNIQYIFLKSLPLMIQFLLSIGAWLVFFILVEHIGKAESAVSQILRSVFGIVGVATWALGSTCNSMVSNLIGQGNQQQVIHLVYKILRLSFIFSFILGLPLIIFPEYFLNLMTSDAEIALAGIVSLRIVVMATWMLSLSTIYFNAVVGTGNTRFNMYIEIAAIALYLGYTFLVVEIFKLSLPWAWGSEFVYWFSLFLMSATYLHSKKWMLRPINIETKPSV
jgi:putative MATE family efflux protein